MSQEIELKLSLPPGALAALRRHPRVAEAPAAAPVATLVNTYYDTPTQQLSTARIALRTRRQGRRWLQTVKAAAASVAGLSARPEWEGPFAGIFDFSAVDHAPTRAFLERHAAALVPLFNTIFRRETRRLEPRPGASVLLMIDRGTVSAGERCEPICEIELELERGESADLFALAIELAEALPLLPEDVSKAERGLRLFRGEAPSPLRAEAMPLDSALAPLEAFRTLAWDCLRQWQANAGGAAHDKDPEFVHQMRVALRRLRSLLGLFAPLLAADWVARWSTELAAEAGKLGEVREFDVLLDELLAPVLADELTPEPLLRLAARLSARRERARRQLARQIAARGSGARMLRFAAELQALGTAPGEDAPTLGAFATERLAWLRRRARRRWHAAIDTAPASLHRLRIALKKLRYGLEFFAPLMPPRSLRRFLARMARAQEVLGRLNDLEVGAAHLAADAGKDVGLRAAAAYASGWHAPRRMRARRRILPAVERLLWGKAPWQAARRRG